MPDKLKETLPGNLPGHKRVAIYYDQRGYVCRITATGVYAVSPVRINGESWDYNNLIHLYTAKTNPKRTLKRSDIEAERLLRRQAIDGRTEQRQAERRQEYLKLGLIDVGPGAISDAAGLVQEMKTDGVWEGLVEQGETGDVTDTLDEFFVLGKHTQIEIAQTVSALYAMVADERQYRADKESSDDDE